MKQPNLFTYATSELSQDAFFCWLLCWADDKFKSGNNKQQGLNKIAKELLSLFFSKSNLNLPSTVNVEILKQDGNIDILCIINKQYCIIIEDKVGTIQHSNQLDRYKTHVDEKGIYKVENIIPIYLQTRDQSDYRPVTQNGFKVVGRKDILGILTKPKFAETREYSDILNDYTSHLEKIEYAVNSFKDKIMEDWGRDAWIGFFLMIQEQFPEADWGYVPNASGGFMGLWCFFNYLEKMDVYLQFEEQKICFKVAVDEKEKESQIRDSLLKLFTSEAKNFDLDVVKPARLGRGAYMTFAILKDGFKPVMDIEGKIDFEKLIKTLNQLKAFIEHCVKKIDNQQ